MTNEQINIAIATACGWKNIEYPWGIPPVQNPEHPDGCQNMIPNYCEDLNAIASAVATLSDEEYLSYWVELGSKVHRDKNCWHMDRNRAMVEATALQRCEAFLRVKGLWVEENK